MAATIDNRAAIAALFMLKREDADLINNCYQNPRSIHSHHVDLHSYFYREEIDYPIFVMNELDCPDELDGVFIEFVNDYLHQPLKDMILNSTWSDVLDFCTILLLQHNCYIDDSCKKYMSLIMKLRIIGKKEISVYSMIRDFRVLAKYKSEPLLLALYFCRFIDDFGLTGIFFGDFPSDIPQYFLETATIFVPFTLEENFHDRSHGLLRVRKFAELELLITFGIRNLELFEDGYNLYYNVDYSHEFDNRGVVLLIIDNRIKMRIVQIFLMFKAQNAILLQKIMATNLEPYLTKQQYEDAFNEICPYVIDRMYFAPVIEQRWNWYKKMFKITDDTPVMPRKLQDICRLSIRDILAWRGKLPSGVDSISKSDILRKYLKLEDLVEYSID